MRAAISQGLIFFFFWLLLIAASYRHTPIALLRGEAGWYQTKAHAPIEEQRHLEHFFLTRSLKGHYLPIGFWSDFRFTKWAGMREPVWRARQIMVLAILATTLFLLILSLGRIWEFPRVAQFGIAAGLTAMYVFQPHMTDIVAWPTMVLQLGWLIFTSLTLCALVKLVTSDSKTRWAWLAAAFAYCSMHAFGLGLATSWAAAAVLFSLWWAIILKKLPAARGAVWNVGLALFILVILSTAHALYMLQLGLETTPPATIKPAGISPIFGLIALYPFVFATSLFVRLFLAVSTIQNLGSAWLIGTIILIAAPVGLYALGRSALERPAPLALARFALTAFSVVAFLGCILLIAVRQTREPGEQSLLAFLNSSSYVVTVGFTLAGIGLVAVLSAARRVPMIAMFLLLGLGLGSFVARRDYEINAYPKTVPYADISHPKAWRLILNMARETRAANLPIPNIPMYPLAWFSDWNLEKYEELLHDELRLKPEERCQFVAWDKCRGDERSRYEGAVPSLRKVIAMLHLETDANP